MKILGYIFTAVGCYLFMMGWQHVAKQDQIIRGSLPMKVVVLDKRIKEEKAGDGITYAPAIVYSYTIGKNVYHSDRVLPVEQAREKKWAEAYLSGYSIGKTYTGYYNPQDYSKSFLVRRYSIGYYLPLLAFLAIFDVGLSGIVGAFTKPIPELKPDPKSPGWYKIEPESDIPTQLLTSQVITSVWWFGTFLILGSYTFVAQPYLSNWLWYSLAGAIAFGAYPTYRLFKLSKAAQSISNVTVLANVSKLVRGHDKEMKAILSAEKTSTFRSLTASVICRELLIDDVNMNDKILYNKEVAKVDAGTTISPGRPLTLEFTFSPPPDQPATQKKSTSHTQWYVLLKGRTADGGAFDESFPFVVHSESLVSK